MQAGDTVGTWTVVSRTWFDPSKRIIDRDKRWVVQGATRKGVLSLLDEGSQKPPHGDLSSLESRRVLKVLDASSEWVVTELSNGPTFEQVLHVAKKRRAAIPIEFAVKLTCDVGLALEALRGAGVQPFLFPQLMELQSICLSRQGWARVGGLESLLRMRAIGQNFDAFAILAPSAASSVARILGALLATAPKVPDSLTTLVQRGAKTFESGAPRKGVRNPEADLEGFETPHDFHEALREWQRANRSPPRPEEVAQWLEALLPT